MDRGYIKQYRRELDSDIWVMPPVYGRVWKWILLKAKWKKEVFPTPRKFGIHINPGQLITSYDLIAKGVMWLEWGKDRIPNKKTIKVVIDWLESQGMIGSESNANGTFIYVIKWDTYQSIDTAESNAEETQEKRLLETIKELQKKLKELKDNNVKTFSSDSIEIRLAEYLKNWIIKNNSSSKAKVCNVQGWAKIIDYMIRLDGRNPEEIKNVIKFAQTDSFWMQNILSTSKLREKYDQLFMKMKGNGAKTIHISGRSGADKTKEELYAKLSA